MVSAINSANFGGRQLVTCNTCHRGQPSPQPSWPSLAFCTALRRRTSLVSLSRRRLGSLPQINFLTSTSWRFGGAKRLADLTSLVARGTYLGFDDAETSAVEIFAKAPGQRTTIIHTLSGDSTTTYDGRTGWIAAHKQRDRCRCWR